MNSQGGACHQGRQISSGGRLLGKGRQMTKLSGNREIYEYEMGKEGPKRVKRKIISYTNPIIPPSPFLCPTALLLPTPPRFQGAWYERFDYGSSRLHTVRCGIVSWRSRRMPIASLPPAVHFINCNQHTASPHLSCLLAGTAGDVIRPLKHWTKCHSSQIGVSASG